MLNRSLCAMAVLCCATSVAADGEDFLCITDKATGFNHDSTTDSWDRSSFLPGERFRIVALDSDQYRIERIDETRPWTAECTRRSDLDADSFTCADGTTTVHFNRESGRFTAFRYFGYWRGSTDSISLSIGSCWPD